MPQLLMMLMRCLQHQDNDLERDFAVHRTEADYDAAEVTTDFL